jgi:hypothetical protein
MLTRIAIDKEKLRLLGCFDDFFGQKVKASNCYELNFFLTLSYFIFQALS